MRESRAAADCACRRPDGVHLQSRLPNPDRIALNSGLQNKDKAAKAVAAAKPAAPVAPERATAARREIRTVLVAAHGWPTDALLTTRRTSRR